MRIRAAGFGHLQRAAALAAKVRRCPPIQFCAYREYLPRSNWGVARSTHKWLPVTSQNQSRLARVRLAGSSMTSSSGLNDRLREVEVPPKKSRFTLLMA